MQLLVLGSSGQLGSLLVETLSVIGNVSITNRQVFNLLQPQMLYAQLQKISPLIILHAAAYTHVDNAEIHTADAMTCNVLAVAEIARYCANYCVPLIYYSTDYVFDGKQRRAYKETDICCPLNVYGKSKYQGEQVIIASGCPYVILRISWLYSGYGHNFANNIIHQAQYKKILHVVNDQYGAPTWAKHVADVTLLFVVRILSKCSSLFPLAHIFHLTATGQGSWYDFAQFIIDTLSLDCQVKAISSAQLQQRALRPSYSVLDNTKLYEQLGVCLPDWRQSCQCWLYTDQDRIIKK